ncbi:MAG TPA: hypothetical protein VGF21_01995 [Thermoleophilaceae bacterium]
MNGPLPPIQGLAAFMAALAGREPSGFIELRYRRQPVGGMRQRFFDAQTPNAAATAATVLSQHGDVYVGCAPRTRREGGKDAVLHGWTLWVDCDDPQAIAALEQFRPQPGIVVRSSPRGLHAYWPLAEPLDSGELERANRRLAHGLGACQSAVTNAAALLRPPATLNYKYDPPATVVLKRLTGERFSASQIIGELADPPSVPRRGAGRTSRERAEDPLLAIAPPVYVETLTGRPVGRDGKIACPFHPDSRPSFHAYADPRDGWACYSAKCWRADRPNGGDIYDLAAQLWGLSTRGPDFPELRSRLRALFLPAAAPSSESRRNARNPQRSSAAAAGTRPAPQ